MADQNPKISINITGVQGSGKTGIWNILREALESNGYKSTRLAPHGKHEERLLAWNEFHDIEMETEQIQAEEVKHG